MLTQNLILGEHHLHTTVGFPHGSQLVSVHYEPARNAFFVVMEHESFPIPLPGAEIEWITPIGKHMFQPTQNTEER
jgi:hypothetical protein